MIARGTRLRLSAQCILSREELRDLRGVERRAFAQVVAADEELDAVRVIERLADPADPGRVRYNDALLPSARPAVVDRH